MQITRDNRTFELTEAELRDAYEEYKRDCVIEDIKSRFILPKDETKQGKIVDMFERRLSKCDDYFDCYWECIYQTAEEFKLKEN